MSTCQNTASYQTEQTNSRPVSKRPLWPILLVNFSAMAGAYAFVAIAGPMARMLQMQAWHVGVIISLVGLVWMLTAKLWGRYVDQFGRIPVLKLCLLGFTLAYLLMSAYVWWVLEISQQAGSYLLFSVAALMLCRALMGGFYAGIPVAATAWIADHYPMQQRAAVLAKLGASGAVGMVLAPPLAGWIAQRHLPLALLVFAISGILVLPVLRNLPEFQSDTHKLAATCKLSLRDPRLRSLLGSNFICFSVVIIANSCLGFYLIDRLQLSAANAAAIVGLALGAAGIALVLAQSLVSRLTGVSGLLWIRLGSVVAACGFASCLLVPAPLATWVCLGYFMAGLGLGMVFPALSALASNAVTQQEQGACAGLMSVMQGLSMMLAPTMGTLIYEKWPQAPYLLNAILLLCVLIMARQDAGHSKVEPN